MSREAITFPPRLKDLEGREADLLRAVPARPALSSEALHRIGATLEAALPSTRLRLRRPAFALAALGIALPLAATAAFAIWPHQRSAPAPATAPRAGATVPQAEGALAPHGVVTPRTATPKPPPSHGLTARTPMGNERSELGPSRMSHAALVPAPLPAMPPSASTVEVPPAVPSRAPAPNSSALAEEAAWLQRAMHQLQREHDAEGALQTLATFEIAFPNSPLLADARSAQIDADLVLDRDADALTVLDHFAETRFAGAARAPSLRALRGEILARLGRCAEALTAFAPLLDNPEEGIRERALYGHAICEVQLGDPAEARSELLRYVQAFPRGAHGAAARAALGQKH